jgi:hypothetical protein
MLAIIEKAPAKEVEIMSAIFFEVVSLRSSIASVGIVLEM